MLRTLKSDDGTKMIPIVMLTASREVKDVERGYHFGVNSYVIKPSGFNEFLEAVKNLSKY